MGYTDITVQSVVLAYKLNHPNDGEVMTIGHLRACQIHVPRSEIRSVIHRVDSKSRHGFSKSRHRFSKSRHRFTKLEFGFTKSRRGFSKSKHRFTKSRCLFLLKKKRRS